MHRRLAFCAVVLFALGCGSPLDIVSARGGVKGPPEHSNGKGPGHKEDPPDTIAPPPDTTPPPPDTTSPPPPPPPYGCLATALTIERAVATEDDYYFLTEGHAVDARNIVWQGDGSESDWVDTHGTFASCWTGGVIDGGQPFDAVYECESRHCPDGNCPDPCFAYHSAAGIGPEVTDVQIFEDVLIRRSGDGISMEENSGDVVARGLYMYEIHDDAFENDFGRADFTVVDNLVESASSAFAMRLRSSASGTDQRGTTWTIRDNLVRLISFPNNYAQREGHANLYKLEGDENEPAFRITGNVFVLGPVMGSEDIFPPVSRTVECADNVLLWTGTEAQWDSYQGDGHHPDGGTLGERHAALNAAHGASCMAVRIKPDGMSVDEFLTAEGWYAAVDAWKATHPAGAG